MIQFIDLSLITKRPTGICAVPTLLLSMKCWMVLVALTDHLDTMAERAVQLGGVALGHSGHQQQKPAEKLPAGYSLRSEHLKELADVTPSWPMMRKASAKRKMKTPPISYRGFPRPDKFLWMIEGISNKRLPPSCPLAAFSFLPSLPPQSLSSPLVHMYVHNTY